MSTHVASSWTDAADFTCPGAIETLGFSQFRSESCIAIRLEDLNPFVKLVVPPMRQLFYEVILIEELPTTLNHQIVGNHQAKYNEYGIQFQAPCHISHWDHTLPGSFAWKGIGIIFTPDVLCWDINNSSIEYSFPFFSQSGTTYLQLSESEYQTMLPWFQAYEKEVLVYNKSDKIQIVVHLANLILKYSTRLYNEKNSEKQVGSKTSELAIRYQDFVNNHFHESSVNIQSIISSLYVSRIHLFNSIRSELGITPHDVLTNRRLAEAKKLLKSTDLPVKAISAMCGYDDWAYFTRLFKSRVGTTPGEWRKT